MHHLIALLGNYGAEWRHLPLVARTVSGDVIVLVDHRMPIKTRSERVHEIAVAHGIKVMERAVVDPPPEDCSVAHDWVVIKRDGEVSAVCQRWACLRREPLQLAPDISYVGIDGGGRLDAAV